MNRDVPFDPEAVCDVCGAQGAFDLMGDVLCPECLMAAQDTDELNVEIDRELESNNWDFDAA